MGNSRYYMIVGSMYADATDADVAWAMERDRVDSLTIADGYITWYSSSMSSGWGAMLGLYEYFDATRLDVDWWSLHHACSLTNGKVEIRETREGTREEVTIEKTAGQYQGVVLGGDVWRLHRAFGGQWVYAPRLTTRDTVSIWNRMKEATPFPVPINDVWREIQAWEGWSSFYDKYPRGRGRKE